VVTGCGCHDPAVFGHQDLCEDRLGPRSAGGGRRDYGGDLTKFRQEYAYQVPGPNGNYVTGPPRMEWRNKLSVVIRSVR